MEPGVDVSIFSWYLFGLFYASGRLIHTSGLEYFHLNFNPVVAAYKSAITAHHSTGIIVKIPISQSETISARGSLISLPSSQSVTITAGRNFTNSSSLVFHRGQWGYEFFFLDAMCLPQQGIRSHGFPLMSVIVNSSRGPIVSFTHRTICTTIFFPPSVPLMYNKQTFTLDRATLMYATGRPSNVHFLAAQGSLFCREAFRRKGLFSPSR